MNVSMYQPRVPTSGSVAARPRPIRDFGMATSCFGVMCLVLAVLVSSSSRAIACHNPEWPDVLDCYWLPGDKPAASIYFRDSPGAFNNTKVYAPFDASKTKVSQYGPFYGGRGTDTDVLEYYDQVNYSPPQWCSVGAVDASWPSNWVIDPDDDTTAAGMYIARVKLNDDGTPPPIPESLAEQFTWAGGTGDDGAILATGYLVLYAIYTVTDYVLPVGADRLDLGVGEGVRVYLYPTSITPVSWSASGNGQLEGQGNPAHFLASDQAGGASVTASWQGGSAAVSFSIIAPSGVVVGRAENTGVYHWHGVPSVGFLGKAYLTPDTVWFGRVHVLEQEAELEATGYLEYLDGEGHHPAAGWVSVGNVVTGVGSQVGGTDTITLTTDNHSPYAEGHFSFSIPWLYKVGMGEPRSMGTVTQSGGTSDSGSATISKDGHVETRALDDPDNFDFHDDGL